MTTLVHNAHAARQPESYLGKAEARKATRRTSGEFRALVVDDEPLICKAVRSALEQEGFQCHVAVDGIDALQCLQEQDYDLVVTDLRMPRMHGHALATKLLARNPRPMIVVHSAVDDASLAKDLMLRGVDDIIYKPANYLAFAAKTKAMLTRNSIAKDRRSGAMTESNPGQQTADMQPDASPQPATKTQLPVDEPVPLSDIEERLPLVSRILPVSKSALDVFEMTREGCDAPELGAAIRRDAALAAEVLSIANSSFYNPTGKPVSALDKAVVRIGQRRTGELALAASTLSGMTTRKIPWLDMNTMWRQSIAAGVAIELLVAKGRHAQVGENLALIAIMHSLGRVVLGTLYPAHYRHFIQQCAERSEALIDQERAAFPENHGEIMARLLAEWNISEDLCRPLKHILDPYEVIAQVAGPMRTKAELVKLAVFVGQVAMQAWHPWDLLEIPPESVLERLQISDINGIIERTRSSTLSMVNMQSSGAAETPASQRNEARTSPIYYRPPTSKGFDFVEPLVRSLGFDVVPLASGGRAETKILVNELNHSAAHPPQDGPPLDAGETLVITNIRSTPKHAGNGNRLLIPTSCANFRSALRSIAKSTSE